MMPPQDGDPDCSGDGHGDARGAAADLELVAVGDALAVRTLPARLAADGAQALTVRARHSSARAGSPCRVTWTASRANSRRPAVAPSSRAVKVSVIRIAPF